MANVTITQLPVAGPILGTELVPVVQDGQTRQTTTSAIAASPSQLQTFLTLNQEATLPNSRRLSVQTGLGLTDGGALSTLALSLNGASGALETALTGIVAKTGSTTVVARTLTASGLGLSITNGSGVAGNPTFALTGQAAGIANLTGPGMVSVGGGSVNARVLLGTVKQIDVVNGDGSGSPTFGIALNPVIPGVAAMIPPKGTTAERPGGTAGEFRYNTDLQTFEGYASGAWVQFPTTGSVTSFSAGTTGFTPSVATGGAVTLAGTLNVVNGGTGQTTYTNGQLLIGNTVGNTLTKATLTAGSGVSITNGNGSISISATGSGGTVTSVGWTGGIVSVATATTTPAFTIAGTSGGIPYFSSGTTWASSAALAANALVVGGGAGLAPATVTTGTNVITALGVNVGAVGAFVVNGGALGTPSSGTLTNATGLPISTGISGLGTGVATSLAVNTGTAGSIVVNGGALGTPASGTLTNVTGLPLSTGVTGTLPVANGGTGQTSYTDGQLLIGNSTGNTLTKSTLTQGSGITITNGSGAITIANASPMTYPAAGIPNSTGSAWGTSYSTTGSGTVVALATSPSFTTPSLGAATATSINKVVLTAPAGGSTLTIADTKTLTVSNTLTFTGTDGTSFAYPGSSGTVVTLDATQTLTNKRITARVSSTTSISSPLAWNSDNFDQYAATAQAGALTINADSGTPTDGQRAIFRLKDNGTPRALTWTTGSTNSFQTIGVTLPTTTVANKTTYVGVIYNSSASRWDAVAVTTEA